jgi:hypothetical protein
MDPLTLLATAKAAHSAIMTAVSVGKDIHSAVGDLSKLWSSVAGLTQAAAAPPKGGFLNAGSAEARALEIFAAKKEAEQLQTEVENFIVSEWGLAGLDSLRKEITEQKKLDKQRRLQAEKEQEELFAAFAFYGTIFLLLVGALTGIFLAFLLLR